MCGCIASRAGNQANMLPGIAKEILTILGAAALPRFSGGGGSAKVLNLHSTTRHSFFGKQQARGGIKSVEQSGW